MSSIKINDSRTQVVEVYSQELKGSSGTEYELRFKVKGNSTGMSHFNAKITPDSISLIAPDKVSFVDAQGNKRTAVITANGVYLTGMGFTVGCAAPAAGCAKPKKERKERTPKVKKTKAEKKKLSHYDIYNEMVDCYDAVVDADPDDNSIEVLTAIVGKSGRFFELEYDFDADDYADFITDHWEEINKKEIQRVEKENRRRDAKLEMEESIEEGDDEAAVAAGTMSKDEAKARRKAREKKREELERLWDEELENAEEEPDEDEVAKKTENKVKEMTAKIAAIAIPAYYALDKKWNECDDVDEAADAALDLAYYWLPLDENQDNVAPSSSANASKPSKPSKPEVAASVAGVQPTKGKKKVWKWVVGIIVLLILLAMIF